MGCTCPVDVWPACPPDKGIKFKPTYQGAVAFSVPCGQCISCRVDKARHWSVRCVHEAMSHDYKWFLTLTFDEEHLPRNGSISKRDLRLFFKRMRKLGLRFRYLACGEYGDQQKRAHYHVILYGPDFPDKYPWLKAGSGEMLYRSPLLEKAWPFGHALIGQFSQQSAAYVASYTVKKLTGPKADLAYRREVYETTTGELSTMWVEPPFIMMSLKPGLGASWFAKFQGDAFPSDFVIINGKRFPVPTYYKKLLLKADEAAAAAITRQRKKQARKHAANNLPSRLITRHESAIIRANRRKTTLDEVL